MALHIFYREWRNIAIKTQDVGSTIEFLKVEASAPQAVFESMCVAHTHHTKLARHHARLVRCSSLEIKARARVIIFIEVAANAAITTATCCNALIHRCRPWN